MKKTLSQRFGPYFKMRQRDPQTGKPIRPAATPAGQPSAASPGAGASAAANVAQPAAGKRSRRERKRAKSQSATLAPAQPVGNQELVRRRESLARDLAEMQWDLGGLAYEMAIRDHFRLDLLVRQAAQLRTIDAELAAVERLLHTEQGGAAGTCPACGALYSRGAMFCWQCGKSLMPAATATTAGAASPPGTPASAQAPGASAQPSPPSTQPSAAPPAASQAPAPATTDQQPTVAEPAPTTPGQAKERAG